MDLNGPGQLPAIWFFVPLPHPLAVPHGWRSEWPATIHEALSRPAPVPLRSSCLIHQAETETSSFVASMAYLWRIAVSAMDFGGQRHPTPDLPIVPDRIAATLATVRSVAEVVVFHVEGHDDNDLIEALDMALDHIRLVQRSVAAGAEMAVRLISREMLPPIIPIYRGHFPIPKSLDAASGEIRPTGHEAELLVLPRSAGPSALGLRPEMPDEDTLQRIAQVEAQLGAGQAFDAYIDLRREAMVQRHLDGNRRMTVLALAIAGEVFLDVLLLHLLWEEHTPPEAAQSLFDRQDRHTRRVLANLPDRLGGAWDPSASTGVANYLQDLVRLRHRVVHTGHEPTADELNAAWASLFALERFVGDRLAHDRNLSRYPRTAVAWLGERGLRRRGRLTRRIRRLMEDPNEPNWSQLFSRYQLRVDAAMQPQSPEPDGRSLLVHTCIHEDGHIEWFLYDEETYLASPVQPAAVASEEQIGDMHELAATNTGVCVQSRLTQDVPDSTTWHPAENVMQASDLFAGTATPWPQRHRDR